MQRIGALQLVIIILVLATALVHLGLGAQQLQDGMMGGMMFILNGFGYIGLLAALYLPLPIKFVTQNRALVRWALMAFAVITILAWLAIGIRDIVGYSTKSIEVILIVLLLIESRQK